MWVYHHIFAVVWNLHIPSLFLPSLLLWLPGGHGDGKMSVFWWRHLTLYYPNHLIQHCNIIQQENAEKITNASCIDGIDCNKIQESIPRENSKSKIHRIAWKQHASGGVLLCAITNACKHSFATNWTGYDWTSTYVYYICMAAVLEKPENYVLEVKDKQLEHDRRPKFWNPYQPQNNEATG